MARKEKLQLKDVSAAAAEAEARPQLGTGGQYGQAMKQHLAATKADLENARTSLGDIRKAVLAGRAAVEIDPAQVRDGTGTDRLGDWVQAEEFASLKENIRERGQTQPIRVRPERADWEPDAKRPFEIAPDERFIVQSGRRRLEACRQLGVKVLAIVVMEEGDARLADLTERYFENKMREDLTALEELLAIASIAKEMESAAAAKGAPKPSQREIAEHIGTNQAYVSLGLTCDRYRDVIQDRLPANATVREVRDLLPTLKGQGEVASVISTEITPEAAPDLDGMKVRVKEVRPVRVVSLARGGNVRIKPTSSGVSLTVRNVAITPEKEAEFEEDLKRLLERYEG